MDLFNLEVIEKGFFKEGIIDQAQIELNNSIIEVKEIIDDKFVDKKKIIVKFINDKNEYETILTIENKKKHATITGERSCNCDYFKDKKENCMHMGALVLYLNDFTFKDITLENLKNNNSSEQLLENIEQYKKQINRMFEFEKTNYVTPLIEFHHNFARISFKIHKKYSTHYDISDLNYFLELINKKEKYIYGRNNEIIHDFEFFDSKSQKIISLIDLNKVYINPKEKKYIDLSIGNFYKFLDLFNENLIINLEGKNYSNLQLIETDNPFKLVCTKHEENINIKLVTEQKKIHQIYNSFFWLDDNNFYFYKINDYNFLNLLKTLYNKNLQLSENDFEDFRVFVLSMIDDKIEIIMKNIENKKNYDPIEINLNYKNENFELKLVDKENLNLEKVINFVKRLSYYGLIKNRVLYIDDPKSMYYFYLDEIDYLKKDEDLIINFQNFDEFKVINDININTKYTANEHEQCRIDFSINNFNPKEIVYILENILKDRKYMKINNKIICVEDEIMRQIKEIFALFHLNINDYKEQLIGVEQIITLFDLKEYYNKIKFEFDQKIIRIITDIKELQVEDYNPNQLINCQLRDYQEYGINFILTMFNKKYNCILADEMGLGKTIQALAVVNYFVKKDFKILIVTPTSLILNWDEEIKKFLNGIEPAILIGNKNERKKIFNELKHNIYITSYELLKRDINLYEEEQFDLFILDEAQYIKNHQTQNYNVVSKIKAKHKLVLTGTPIENSVMDLWSLMNFIFPGYLGTNKTFIKKFKKDIQSNDQRKIKLFRNITSSFILRRLKSDVLELPDKNEKYIFIDMNEKQKKLYKKYEDYVNKKISNEDLNKIEILSMIMRLRQIANDPRLIKEEIMGEKVNKISELLLNIEGKVLIFSQFTTMLDLIQEELNKQKIENLILTGKTSKVERKKLVEKFSENDIKVFLISLKAGGTGLNLVSANNVIIVDPWWNLSVQNQATDRVHRIGQTKEVNIIKLITKNSIEEKIVDIQNQKNELSNALLDIDNKESIDIDIIKELLK